MRHVIFMNYKIYTRHMVMAVLVVLLIISNLFDRIAVGYWDFTWGERKIAETVFVIIGAVIICPVLYRRYFKIEEADDE